MEMGASPDIPLRQAGLTSLSMGSVILAALLLLVVACGGSSAASYEPTPDATATPIARTPEVTPTPLPPTPVPTAAPPSRRVTLNAAGDIMLARDLITMMDTYGSAAPYAAVRDLLADADLTIANMEGTFTDRGTQQRKLYTFRTPPHHAHGLREAGIDIVSLGNNHTMDYGAVGMQDTRAALDAAGVLHSGAGMNEFEARSPVLTEVNGLRLAFLSYNAVTESTPAGPSSPGEAFATDGVMRHDVAFWKQHVDLVIVSLHAGTEYVDAPNGVQLALARAAVESGASLVLGHHAHVLQGWGWYGEGVIVYGLGNFVFDLDADDLRTLGERPFQSIILRFELAPAGVVSVTPRPVYIDPLENRPVPATGDRLRGIEQRLERLNAAAPH
jgi:poly-gamma-glutamate capsule biosynthesis protein CapA/YwtB (metallophosphatase superfamily)